MNTPKLPIESLLDGVSWKATGRRPDPSEENILFSTHEGTLEIMGHSLRCYRLNNGQAVFNADDLEAFLSDILGVDIKEKA